MTSEGEQFMPKYQVKQEVPWRRILKTLRVHLTSREFLYEQKASTLVAQDMRETYEAYRDLRKFLGYTEPTKCEQRIKKLLNK